MADLIISVVILEKDVADFMEKMLIWKPKTQQVSNEDWIRKMIVENLNSKYQQGLFKSLDNKQIVK